MASPVQFILLTQMCKYFLYHMQYSFSRICRYIGFFVDFIAKWLNLPWSPLHAFSTSTFFLRLSLTFPHFRCPLYSSIYHPVKLCNFGLCTSIIAFAYLRSSSFTVPSSMPMYLPLSTVLVLPVPCMYTFP